MKKINAVFALLMTLALTLSGCAETSGTGNETAPDNEAPVTAEAAETESAEPAEQKSENPEEASETSANVLVVYFSATGNTKQLAETVAGVTGGDLYEIIPAEPYTTDDLNYNDSSSRTTIEQNDSESRPEIAGTIENFDAYDTVFLGYPIWWGDAAHIMFTFAESYDFGDKTVIPFCTSGSSPIGSSARNIESLASGGTWLEGKRMTKNTTAQEISEWISDLGIDTAVSEEANLTKGETMRITVTCGSCEITYELNDSKAAKSLYAQLPLTLEEEDFSNNEKTFYPPEKLDVSDAPMAEGGSGILAYYEPWGDAVMFYGAFAGNSGLYELGKAVSGEENISKISGTIEINKAE